MNKFAVWFGRLPRLGLVANFVLVIPGLFDLAFVIPQAILILLAQKTAK
jgi:hypothetical protein